MRVGLIVVAFLAASRLRLLRSLRSLRSASPRFALVSLLALSACWKPVAPYNCLQDGGCECVKQDQCPGGWDCVDGFCKQLPDAGPPGDVGKPCDAGTDCLSGFCLPRGPGNGEVCSVECNADGGTNCPNGWVCKQRLDSSAYACVPPFHALCLSCVTDSDCNAEGDRCVPGADGGICGEDCSLFPCPDGYECRGLAVDGGVAHQCLPPTLSCDCSPVNVGLKRSCKNTNAMATCFGFETCRADGGFSACDARAASPEVCNGIDDDCNGLTDDADPSEQHPDASTWPDCTRGLTCKGAFYCGLPPDADADAGYDFQCSAPPILPEKCNGLDDNCNGQIDEGFTDSMGLFSTPGACGSCALDCAVAIPNLLASDAGVVVPGAVDCLLADAGPRCIPKQCAPGFFPWPPGLAELCQPVSDTECRPCTIDDDCGIPGDVCATLSNDVGSYCLQSCGPGSPHTSCPMGSSCQTVSGASRCVPDDQACSCTPARAGFTRSCTRTFGAAICIGDQVCRADGGFDSCDTSLTAAELCDGLDNDCNGKIDDPFINTQGSGTYDTDQHCGNCTTNCLAQWSPTIQHAIGGCRLSVNAGPVCKIVQCTAGTQPGGKLCQSNADCATGAVCDSTFHQCEKPCSAGCAMGEICSNGGCTQACSTDATCANAYGANSSCGDAGACVNNYQFVNADGDPTNGCECPSIAGVTDTPDLYPTYPGVGVTYVDRDCDGIDGTAARSLFVSVRSTSSQGTRSAPFKTIAEAIAAFDPSRYDAILVAQGTYVEQVVLKDGVNLYGGYSPDFSKRDVITYPSLIEAAQPDFTVPTARRGTVNAESLSSPSTVAGFTIRGYDVLTRPSAGNNAINSYAIYVSASPGLTLANNHVVGGRGADAVPADPGQVGAQGGAGTQGLDAKECMSTNCSGETQAGGAGGTNASCGAAAGNSGATANPLNNPQDYQAPSGLNGRGGSNAQYEHQQQTPANLCKYDCTVPSNGLDGLPASNGGDGTSGAKGNGCSSSIGLLMNGDWIAASSAPGAGGLAGVGAGGGGAGGCVMNLTPATCTVGHHVGDLGATGGGGGAGGCGGTGGRGGGGGGGSFGIFIVGSPPKVFGNLVEPGFGGAGGPGGAGGYGGLGGPGGAGGQNNAIAWCAGIGGAGGRGGNGGPGGGGGGGCGGISAGIAGAAIAGLGYDTQNTLVSPPLQAGGPGGSGGPSPASTSTGSAGSQGSADTLRSF